MNLSEKSKNWAILAARQAFEYFFDTKSMLVHDALEIPEEVKQELCERAGIFAVIKSKDKATGEYAIRGMMGSVHPSEEVWKIIPVFSVNAAFFDHRTPRLKPYELNEIHVHFVVIDEIEEHSSTLEELTEFLDSEHPGIMMEYNNRESFFLPYVWNNLPEATQVLRMLALQMGLKATMYTSRDVRYKILKTYEFGEFEQTKPI